IATRSCITSIDSIKASAITTIEAIGATPAGAKIQKAWLDREVPQCGYCQSGQIMSAAALLTSNARPTDSAIDDAMSGNICRCGTYLRIREAIKQAAASWREAPMTANHAASKSTDPELGSEGRLSRRRFLVAGAVAGGGLLLSLELPFVQGADGASRAEAFAPNAFIRIG